jgi:hypothetical protein
MEEEMVDLDLLTQQLIKVAVEEELALEQELTELFT